MRRIILLLGLIAAAASIAMSQVAPSRPPIQPPPIPPGSQMPAPSVNIAPSAPSTSSPIAPTPLPVPAGGCRAADLSVRHVTEDAAMGGENLIVYALRNNSSTPCTLKGYPRYELLDKAGRLRPRGRAINSQQLPGDETKMAPQLVTVEAGNEAWFRVHYNSGGAGRIGRPCPVSLNVRITAPGTTRTMMVNEDISSCRTIEVSAVRGGPLPE